MILSKSRYVRVWGCPKAAWLDYNKPGLISPGADAQSRIENGRIVGEHAKRLFGPYVDVSSRDETGTPDLMEMARRTREEMEKGTSVICEAAFVHNELYCAVDILRKEQNGWAVYEVKSASVAEQDVFLADVSFQRYVLKQCGVPVSGAYLITINTSYVLDGQLDLNGLFRITDMSEKAELEEDKVIETIRMAKKVYKDENEPRMEIGEDCLDCEYFPYCSRNLPKPNVFNLYRLNRSKKIEYYQKGIVSYEELRNAGTIKNDKQRRQIEYALNDLGTYIDRKGITDFLNTLSYPLYFLDFEGMETAVPFCQGTHPYAQIPFQYSLHFIEAEGGELQHKEYLAVSGTDPRRGIAEALCRDIPKDVCVTVYNKAYECTRLKELAAAFPDLADHLLNISGNIRDLLEPFQKGYYYNREMGGSFSIKSVLPAIYPDDPELDYHNLEGVHNGGEAMSIFPQIQFMLPEEQAKARCSLLKYCELDTYALVKVWEELKRACET